MRNGRIVLALLAVLAAGAAGFGGYVYFNRPPHAPTPTTREPTAAELAASRARIEALILSTPEYSDYFVKLRGAFPADQNEALDALARRAFASGAPPTADEAIAESVRVLRQSRGVLAARADLPAQQRIFAAQATLLGALAKENPRLCVDYLYGGVSEGFLKFAGSRRDLVAEMANAGLAAIIEGHGKRASPERPTDEDFTALEKALADAGLTAAEIAALIDGKTADPPISDARMCEAGRIHLSTLMALPEPARRRFFALMLELMARS